MARTFNWISISPGDLPQEGKLSKLRLGIRPVCLAMLNGQLYAMSDLCPHALASMSNGVLSDEFAVCPAHKLKISVITGKDKQQRGLNCAKYPTRLKGDNWEIGIEKRRWMSWLRKL